jgi:superfamily II DNA or RNA helicase
MSTDVQSITEEYVDELINFAPTPEIEAAGIDKLQRSGCVAIFNMLVRNGLAYLADEVGMGKTYIALAVMSILRYQKPNARVLILTPRKNIQEKWKTDLFSFVQQNWRHSRHRVKNVAGDPVRLPQTPERLANWVNDLSKEPIHDTILRMSSFSFGITPENAETEIKQQFNEHLACPLLRDYMLKVVETPTQQTFADAVRTLVQRFANYDLVIVDEAHNLKHGYQPNLPSSIRNETIHHILGQRPNAPPWLLMLSATPMENGNPSSLARQLEVFGRKDCPIYPPQGEGSDRISLKTLAEGTSNSEVRELLKRFLVRRVGGIIIAQSERYTRNMYRKEWRHGGVDHPEKPMKSAPAASRLINAVIQKNVFEHLKATSQGRFRIGALESFEIYSGQPSAMTETKTGAEQKHTEAPDQRLIAALCSSYRNTFHEEVPHPKLDEVTSFLTDRIRKREKALVFVRRVATTTDLATRVSASFDKIILARIKKAATAAGQAELIESIEQEWAVVRSERTHLQSSHSSPAQMKNAPRTSETQTSEDDSSNEQSTEIVPSFFSWYFRGTDDIPNLDHIYTAHQLRKDLEVKNKLTLIFEENYVDWILGRPKGKNLFATLRQRTGINEETIVREIKNKLTVSPDHDNYRRLFQDVQRATLLWLMQHTSCNEMANKLQIVIDEVFVPSQTNERHSTNSTNRLVSEMLHTKGIYSYLARAPENSSVCRILENSSFENIQNDDEQIFRQSLRRREQIRHMQMALLRHGAPFIDLYLAYIKSRDGDLLKNTRPPKPTITKVAKTLTQQWLKDATSSDSWRASSGWELAEVNANFDLIKKLNFPLINDQGNTLRPLDHDIVTDQSHHISVRQLVNQALARQAPTAAAFGGQDDTRRQRLTTQFRMPGMPWVIVATNVYEEGVDLHTYCSTVIHHGISHSASSIEQRTGRVDRIGGLMQREVANLDTSSQLTDDKKINSLFPYQNDTFEKHQVRRVLVSCNNFLRSLHDTQPSSKDSLEMSLDDKLEIPPQITDRLTSPFDIEGSKWLNGALRRPQEPSGSTKN